MKIQGSNVIEAPVDRVWDALLDPAVLVATIPGCERLAATGEHAYDMTVTAGVAAIKGTYAGTCSLTDLVPHESLVMTLSGSGAPGTVDARVEVSFAEVDGGTQVSYDADATVGGMVGGVGQRMLTSVSKRMAGEFFGNVGTAIASPAAPASAPAPAAEQGGAPVSTGAAAPANAVFSAPAKASSPDDFLKGIAVGAGLVVLGVVVGSVFGRRR
ncbi:MAG TPA: carbon monoxide dehydrogenase subunit G [Nocardioides sp.]|uniref:SRPBCC family protein n=1 Tax=Nocardioides sp. TaxID=35761 RepID=UPI002C287F63|nr:carbon monoxide dehydrogenase subunit G [Nocardioides sp.]HTW15735.1 carbon monoxide dehydrogenase subunit G [Nocardioides sp.]